MFGINYAQVRKLPAPSSARTDENFNFAIDPPDAKSLGQAKAILDDGSIYYGSITRDGSFMMYVVWTLATPHGIDGHRHRPDVLEGTYIFNIVARNHIFDQVGDISLE